MPPTTSPTNRTAEEVHTRNLQEKIPSHRSRKTPSNRLSPGQTRTKREVVMNKTSVLFSPFPELRAIRVDTSRTKNL